MAMQKMAHPDGERGTMGAAAANGMGMVRWSGALRAEVTTGCVLCILRDMKITESSLIECHQLRSTRRRTTQARHCRRHLAGL